MYRPIPIVPHQHRVQFIQFYIFIENSNWILLTNSYKIREAAKKNLFLVAGPLRGGGGGGLNGCANKEKGSYGH